MTDTHPHAGKRHYLSAASRRESIIEVADDIVFKEGVAHLSIVEVARRAEISRQLVYQHFADRNSLLSEVVRRRLNELQASLGAPGALGGGDLRSLLSTRIHLMMNLPARDRALMRSLFGDLSVLPHDLWPTISEIRRLVVARWATLVDPAVEPAALAYAKFGLVMHAIFGAWDLMADRTLDEDEAVDLVVTVISSLFSLPS